MGWGNKGYWEDTTEWDDKGEWGQVPWDSTGGIGPPGGFALLLETGDFILLETGDYILLEP